jgi:hypothetical protein
MWSIVAEDLPYEHNAVTLSGELTDSSGRDSPTS